MKITFSAALAVAALSMGAATSPAQESVGGGANQFQQSAAAAAAAPAGAQTAGYLAYPNGQGGYQYVPVGAQQLQGTLAAYGGGEGEAAELEGHGGGSCSDGSCGSCQSCCNSFWAHRCSVYGEFLYLQARGVDMAYAQPRNGVNLATSVPAGAVGVADPDYQPGFRFGVNLALDNCSSIAGSYTSYESQTFDQISLAAPLVIHSLVTHPGTASAASDSLVANANYDIDFQLFDVEYRRLLRGTATSALNYSLGFRYGRLDTDFTAQQPISPGNTSVFAHTDFEGAGTRIGLDGERKLRGQWFGYGKAFASLLAGNADSTYVQSNTFAQTQVSTSWSDDRIVPVLEYELGLGWQSCRGNLRLSGGYMVSAWFNTVTTNEYVQAVQTSNYVDLGDTLTFDGFVARLEWRR